MTGRVSTGPSMALDRVVHIDEVTKRTWTWSEYQAIDAVHFSTLKHMRRSPLHYKQAVDDERAQVERETDPLRLGSATHIAVFEPDQLARRTTVWLGDRRQGNEWKAFKEKHEGQIILTTEEAHRIIDMRNAVRGNELVRRYLELGAPEQVIQWHDRKTGIACKGRLDWLGAVILDLKTARNACDRRAFSADAFRLGYFHQLQFYRRGLATMRGLAEGPPAVIVAVEPEPPHDLAVYRLSEDALHFVNQHLDELLAKVQACRASGLWPGTFTDEQELDMPKWGYPSPEDMNLGALPSWLEGLP